ncbi:hypothetical protein Pryu01_03062 [Paraliobacillus ryukyuensis]|uniref:Uncharacterized membrane protein YqaE (UPF0057 family) n=1 Tax=Paraliobacillus ryukyuensis TaxID=200904 RepID=A0A366DQA7_9BACI|nr:YqaE/Pmp3 family membrane protein [Paraliobacillus ryukyuensis]RBO92293.1 uncharacterized membrane protein YqaE (UPF0057 family) [Paraliobacillus ryukyuensis]
MRFWAIVFPPVAVLMCKKPFQSFIALLLTICVWVPGIIYAWGIVSDYKADKRMMKQVEYQHDLEQKAKKKEEKRIEKQERKASE